MTPPLLPPNGKALLAAHPHPLHSTTAGNFLSNTNTGFIMVCTICSSRCVCMPSSLDWPTPAFFLYAFTQPLSAPVLGACPGFRQGAVCSQPWQPATLLSLAPCPTILETSQLFALLPYNPSPALTDPQKAKQSHPGPDRNTPEATRPTPLQEPEGSVLPAALLEEGGV